MNRRDDGSCCHEQIRPLQANVVSSATMGHFHEGVTFATQQLYFQLVRKYSQQQVPIPHCNTKYLYLVGKVLLSTQRTLLSTLECTRHHTKKKKMGAWGDSNSWPNEPESLIIPLDHKPARYTKNNFFFAVVDISIPLHFYSIKHRLLN